jgi:hypothetical protein
MLKQADMQRIANGPTGQAVDSLDPVICRGFAPVGDSSPDLPT